MHSSSSESTMLQLLHSYKSMVCSDPVERHPLRVPERVSKCDWVARSGLETMGISTSSLHVAYQEHIYKIPVGIHLWLHAKAFRILVYGQGWSDSSALRFNNGHVSMREGQCHSVPVQATRDTTTNHNN